MTKEEKKVAQLQRQKKKQEKKSQNKGTCTSMNAAVHSMIVQQQQTFPKKQQQQSASVESKSVQHYEPNGHIGKAQRKQLPSSIFIEPTGSIPKSTEKTLAEDHVLPLSISVDFRMLFLFVLCPILGLDGEPSPSSKGIRRSL